MASDGDTEELHLRCETCDDRVGVALLDEGKRLVCHCTHVDGEIAPHDPHGFDPIPSRWEYQ